MKLYDIDVYICKRCTHKWEEDSRKDKHIDHCSFCGSTNYIHTAYGYDPDVLKMYKNDDYRQMRKLQDDLDDPIKNRDLDVRLAEQLKAEGRAKFARRIASNSSKPKCPTCGSTNVNPISTSKRVANGFFFGIFSSTFGKSYECQSCKYKW